MMLTLLIRRVCVQHWVQLYPQLWLHYKQWLWRHLHWGRRGKSFWQSYFSLDFCPCFQHFSVFGIVLECHIFLNMTMFARCLSQITKTIFLKIIAVDHTRCVVRATQRRWNSIATLTRTSTIIGSNQDVFKQQEQPKAWPSHHHTL